MPLQIHLAATLRKYVTGYDPAVGHSVTLKGPVIVRDLARHLHIPEDEVKLIFVNGIHADWDTPLSGDERVALFPPVGGG